MKFVITLGVAATVAIICGTSYVVSYNSANRLEKSVEAAAENNKNILAQYGNKIAEAAQIPDMQRDDLIAVTTAAIEGRYGKDGSKALFQMITEQNPQLDPTLYVQLQQMIEAGRNDFTFAQTELVEKTRIYETQLGSFWTGTWMNVAGYPKIDLEDYKIVSTVRADEAFETKIEIPLVIRK
jgi:hypothetical protein